MGSRIPATIALAIAFGAALAVSGCGSGDRTELRVMSYNVWAAGSNEGKSVDETVAAIEAAGADIVGIQETRLEGKPCTANNCPPRGKSVAPALAEALGYEYYDQVADNDALWANAILSRYPIGAATPNDTGVEIDVDGRPVYVFNVHLDDSPYQPYQLLDINYGGAPFIDTEQQAIRSAERTRGHAIKLLFEDMEQAEDADATFVTGDFNEPSGHDWTAAAAAEGGYQPIPVNWPTTRAIEDRGFVDTYREIWPDPVAKSAFTWTPTGNPESRFDHHDRIDFVLARADGLEVTDAAIVGERGPQTDLVVDPWPSDHRASLAVVDF